MYKCKYFNIEELVPEKLFYDFKDNEDVLWRLFDPDILKAGDWLREEFGLAFINTWSMNENIKKIYGVRNWSGIRTTDSPYYSPNSAHSKCCALDMIFKNISAEDIRNALKKMKNVPYIKRIENGVSWLHVDTIIKPNYPGIYFFNP